MQGGHLPNVLNVCYPFKAALCTEDSQSQPGLPVVAPRLRRKARDKEEKRERPSGAPQMWREIKGAEHKGFLFQRDESGEK